MDSTSMISEAVSYGDANIVVLELDKKSNNTKFDRLLKLLMDKNYIQPFSNSIVKNKKFDFKTYLKGIDI